MSVKHCGDEMKSLWRYSEVRCPAIWEGNSARFSEIFCTRSKFLVTVFLTVLNKAISPTAVFSKFNFA